VSMTYVLFYIILLARIASNSLFLAYYRDRENGTLVAYSLDYFAVYMSLVLGIIQCGCMIKLIWWVRAIKSDNGHS